MKNQEDYTLEELLKCHGKSFRAKITGVECDGKLSVEEGRIYLCQNNKSGGVCSEKHGYYYSWVITKNGELRFNHNDVQVTDFQLIQENPITNNTTMNKEKAIEVLTFIKTEWGSRYGVSHSDVQAIQFAIDYMKESQDEGEIIGWVNYYDGGDNGLNTISDIYTTKELAYQCRNSNYNCIQIPIRKPK